ncbi:protein croquemort [Drosophila miranda]|uniref:protein croquemort n=1 Tax=Drosophila miranda TaxID=7229 RepID=UPI0007E60F26|nr:protein croquemort [Drosophila miranda]
MCCNCCSVRQQKIWVFALGGLAFVLGIVLVAAWPSLSRQLILGMLPLAPDSFMYKRWVAAPMQLYSTFYLFNWTNPEDLNTEGVKPNFEQLGPYTFSDYKVKEDLEWDQPEVTYYGRRTWHFVPDKSNGSLEDVVVTPDFPAVTASFLSRKYRRVLRKVMNFALNREGGSTFIRQTAGESLFDGYYNELLDFVEQLHSPLLPVPSGTFGWLYQRNQSKTAEGNFTIHTGRGDRSRMGDLLLWKGKNHTGYYSGECGKVNGSTGELWSPQRQWDRPTSIFMPDTGRFLNLYPTENVTIDGIDAWRYVSTELTLDNGQLSPDTKCFCVGQRECPLNGVLDFSPATYHGPFYMSHPHFHMTDGMFRENTTGLQPNASEHSMYVIMEPTLGAPLKLRGQLMISVRVVRDEAIDFFKDVAYDHYAPLFTLVLHGEMDDNLRSSLKLALSVPQIGQYTGIAFLLVGLTMVAVGVYVSRNHKWHNEQRPEPIEGVKTNNKQVDATRGNR